MILQLHEAHRCNEQLALYVIGENALTNQFDASRKQLCDLIYNINTQDAEVIKNLQKGRQSDVASEGVYTPFHDDLGKLFHQTVLKNLLAK